LVALDIKRELNFMLKSLDEVKEQALQDAKVLQDKRFSVYKDANGIYYIHRVGETVPPGQFFIEYAQLSGDKWMRIRP
jgi:hypothetical protein